jgi:hypothetical protein
LRRLVLPKFFSTMTQFIEWQSIATHITLMDKKVVLKRKNIIFGIYYVPYFLPFSVLFCFFTFPFLMIFNFHIIEKITFQNFSRPTTNRLQPTSLGNAGVGHSCRQHPPTQGRPRGRETRNTYTAHRHPEAKHTRIINKDIGSIPWNREHTVAITQGKLCKTQKEARNQKGQGRKVCSPPTPYFILILIKIF